MFVQTASPNQGQLNENRKKTETEEDKTEKKKKKEETDKCKSENKNKSKNNKEECKDCLKKDKKCKVNKEKGSSSKKDNTCCKDLECVETCTACCRTGGKCCKTEGTCQKKPEKCKASDGKKGTCMKYSYSTCSGLFEVGNAAGSQSKVKTNASQLPTGRAGNTGVCQKYTDKEKVIDMVKGVNVAKFGVAKAGLASSIPHAVASTCPVLGIAVGAVGI